MTLYDKEISKELEETFNELDKKFSRYNRNIATWILHEWIYYGASYGFELCYSLDTEEWSIWQTIESGYARGDKLFGSQHEKDMWRWVECFAPTNSDYKTERK